MLDWGQPVDPGALPPQTPLRGQGGDTDFRTDYLRWVLLLCGVERYAAINGFPNAEWLTLLSQGGLHSL